MQPRLPRYGTTRNGVVGQQGYQFLSTSHTLGQRTVLRTALQALAERTHSQVLCNLGLGVQMTGDTAGVALIEGFGETSTKSLPKAFRAKRKAGEDRQEWLDRTS